MSNEFKKVDFLIEELAKAQELIRLTVEAFEYVEGDDAVREEFQEGYANGYTLDDAEGMIECFKAGGCVVDDRYIMEGTLAIKNRMKIQFP